jgi:FecR protein
MSLSWTGTIKVSIPCGVVTFSEGDAPAVGTLINPGDIVSTGVKSRVEITIPDGGIYRLGPQSKLQCNGQTTFVPEGRRDNFKLILGSMWAAISDALGGTHEFVDQGRVAAVGVRGSAFTASVQPGGDVVYHVIQGVGFVRVNGKKEFDFPAGEGVRLNPGYGEYTLTTAWPAADQALVPAAQQPPTVTAVRLTGARAGRQSKLHFTLNEKATVTVQIQRGKHRVLTRKAAVGPGARVLTLKALPKGRYTLTVFATVQKRSAAVQKSFRVT